MDLAEMPNPECPKGGALIQVKACSVCGTDVKMFENGHKDLVYPRVLGHEIAGRVVQLDGDFSRIKEGDLVQVWPGIACGQCSQCLKGSDNRCESMEIMGFNRDGGFAEAISVPGESLLKGLNPIKEPADPGLLALAEPLGCSINCQEMARVSEGDSVLILGGGPLGCLNAMLSRHLGAERVLITERLENRIAISRRSLKGIADRIIDISTDASPEKVEAEVLMETDGQKCDVVIAATPEAELGSHLLKLLSPGGRLCIFSGPRPGNYSPEMDLRSVHYRELTISGSYGCSSRHNKMALELIASGALDLKWLLTKRTSLERIEEAFSHASRRDGMRAVIDF
jgi:L-iditol 2-dehydrogenase